MMNSTWERIKSQIKSELPDASYSLWISPLTFLEKKDRSFILGCPNKFARNWVLENYTDLIRKKIQSVCTNDLDIVFKVLPKQINAPDPVPRNGTKQIPLPNFNGAINKSDIRLNKDFTFDRFVVGGNNEFAYSASKALSSGSSFNYDSLLMMASTGLGKSHLAHAVGHAILNQNPACRVRYVTAEDFANDMIFSLKNKRIEEFKNKYRRCCDVLLLEEVHFLSGMEKTQVELGYTLDALSGGNKKIVFTSSMSPKDIPRMSKELSSRLSSGLITSIEGPDYETRVRIINKKADELNLSLSEEIINLLATRLKRDIRQMESALRYLKAKTELLKVKTDVDLAKEVLECLSTGENFINPGQIENMICKYYKIDQDMLRSKSRKSKFTYPRNIYMYLCRIYTRQTLEQIGATINRSHSTVLYASELIEYKMKTENKLKRQIQFLKQKLDEISK
ncbi:chromosomal replication initiator protein DnaA [Thermodesulfobacteriota bacterium]